jgi:hypothetical protein
LKNFQFEKVKLYKINSFFLEKAKGNEIQIKKLENKLTEENLKILKMENKFQEYKEKSAAKLAEAIQR